MKRLITLIGIMLLCITFSFGQQYASAIGARLGSPLAASYKFFHNETNAVEIYAGFRGFNGYSWINVSGAYQIHNDIASVDGLQWYYGGGASIYIWNFDDNPFGRFDGVSNTSVGISGYLGLDYKFADIPLNLSLDWIPTFFINGFGSGFGGGYGSLGVRYVIGE